MSQRSIIAVILIILGILVGVLLYTKNKGKSSLPQIEGVPLEELEVPTLETPASEAPSSEAPALELPFFEEEFKEE